MENNSASDEELRAYAHKGGWPTPYDGRYVQKGDFRNEKV
jgi:hypothetical protein